jgi:integrase
MAYIRAYSGGRYRVEVEKLGVRDSAIFSTKKEARDWGIDREREIEAYRKGIGRTFGMAAQRYLDEVSPKKKSPGSVVWESHRLAVMREYFGESTPLENITRSTIAAWRDYRLKTVKGSTVDREANLLSALLTTARKEWEWMQHNPFDGVKMPNHKANREHVWRWQDIKRVLRHCETSQGEKTRQVGIAFHIALRTALRLKEVLIARKVGNIIVIDDSKTTTKGQKVQIPTTHQGRRVMDRYKEVVFSVDANEASVLFYKACSECGVRVPGDDGPTFHDSRATALTHMSKKMPVQRLQRISRHRDINILTNTYYRETAEEISATL